MAIWGNTNAGKYNFFDFENSSKKGFIEKIISVFGELEVDEFKKDKGVSILDSGKETNPFVHMSSQGTGDYRKYVNYEEASKGTKLRIYRQMSEYPEIFYALDILANEIVNKDVKTKDILDFKIINKELANNINIKDNIRREWDYVVHDLMNFNKDGWEVVKNFLITGEIFYEKIVNPDKKHEGLKATRRLLPDTTYVTYNEHGEIDHFQVGNIASGKKFVIPKAEIAYARFGEMSYNQDTGERIALGYLERVKKVWRQLQLLEEAVIIYRVVRAPERRVWKIATGNMPQRQALQYIEKIKMEYRQRKVYNSATGGIDGQANILSMLDDYWFSQPSEGNSTDVTTLPSGQALGEIRDLEYFLTKLYLALHIPTNRRLETSMGAQQYNIGDVGQINHQETMFAELADRIADRISDVVFSVFRTHMELKGLWKEYELKERDFRVEFYRNNFFEELKRTKLEETRVQLFGSVASYVGEVLSSEYVAKKYLHMSEEEYLENKMLLDKEKKESVQDQGTGLAGGF